MRRRHMVCRAYATCISIWSHRHVYAWLRGYLHLHLALSGRLRLEEGELCLAVELLDAKLEEWHQRVLGIVE